MEIRILSSCWSGNVVIAILRQGKPIDAIDEELALIRQLTDESVPTVDVLGTTTHNGRPAIVMRRYAQGSKDVVRLDNKKVRVVGQSELLNEKSIQDLERIRQVLEERPIKIDDLQFLIGDDGSVVVADPLAVHVGQSPSANNRRMIELLIREARRNSSGE